MIRIKLKICKECKKETRIFSKGMCLQCWQLLHYKPLKRSRPNKVSQRQQQKNEIYSEERTIFLKEHPLCQCRHVGCTMKATEIHHKRGRDGDNLFKYFLACCSNCHHWIEMNPVEAKEQGFSESRLTNEE